MLALEKETNNQRLSTYDGRFASINEEVGGIKNEIFNL